MNIWQAIILGLVQGATEFLPVSSSGHLVLVPWLLGWMPGSLAFDTMVHWGTMVAVLAYFRRDWVRLSQAGWQILRTGNTDSHDKRQLAFVILATIPAGLIGLLLEDFFAGVFANPPATALFLLVTAALLVLAERLGDQERDITSIRWVDALIVGVAQAFAILPGISRSGATISAGLWRGLRRDAAAHFSFLMATPVIFGAGAKQLLNLAGAGDLAVEAGPMLAGFVSAAAVGYLCIGWLMSFLRRQQLYGFAVYCAAFGVFCLMVALARG